MTWQSGIIPGGNAGQDLFNALDSFLTTNGWRRWTTASANVYLYHSDATGNPREDVNAGSERINLRLALAGDQSSIGLGVFRWFDTSIAPGAGTAVPYSLAYLSGKTIISTTKTEDITYAFFTDGTPTINGTVLAIWTSFGAPAVSYFAYLGLIRRAVPTRIRFTTSPVAASTTPVDIPVSSIPSEWKVGKKLQILLQDGSQSGTGIKYGEDQSGEEFTINAIDTVNNIVTADSLDFYYEKGAMVGEDPQPLGTIRSDLLESANGFLMTNLNGRWTSATGQPYTQGLLSPGTKDRSFLDSYGNPSAYANEYEMVPLATYDETQEAQNMIFLRGTFPNVYAVGKALSVGDELELSTGERFKVVSGTVSLTEYFYAFGPMG